MRTSEKAKQPIWRMGASAVGAVRHVVAAAMSVAAALVLCASASAAVPSVSTGGVSGVTSTSVVLHGAINPKGQATNYIFQYGSSSGYSAQTTLATVPGGTATVHVTQAVGDLLPATIYHYRISASSSGGVATGAAGTFKTAKVPLALQIAGAPNPVFYGAPLAVQGTLSGTGAAGRAVALQINPFPYLAGFTTYGNPEVTSATGSFSFPVLGLLENAQMRVVTTTAPLVTSPVLVEGVAVRVTLHARRVHRRRRGEFFSLYGTVAPAEVGASVGFQWIRTGAPSVNQGGTYVTPGTPTVSRFKTVIRIRHRGLYQALVLVKDGSHVSSYSAPVRIR
ncbi:MAG: hypothetical protein WBQ21_02660 [Solirubrobacteraceae bacterium]